MEKQSPCPISVKSGTSEGAEIEAETQFLTSADLSEGFDSCSD